MQAEVVVAPGWVIPYGFGVRFNGASESIQVEVVIVPGWMMLYRFEVIYDRGLR
jgi:hypothetical protein